MGLKQTALLGARVAVLSLLVSRASNRKTLGLLAALLVLLAWLVKAPRQRLRDAILGRVRGEAWVDGYVAPGFHDVLTAFRENIELGYELGAQFVVYFRGEKVVDLCGGIIPEKEYNAESVQVCFSCSKAMTSIVIAMQVEKGLLNYDAKVSSYWPEFAQKNKGDITLGDVLRHEAGLAYFQDGRIPLELAARDRLDELADFIARQEPTWVNKETVPKTRTYHGFTRGFILNEIVRRTDPSRRTIGQIIREELAGPRELSIILGEPTDKELDLISRVQFDRRDQSFTRHLQNLVNKTSYADESERLFKLFNPTSDLYQWFRVLKTSTDEDVEEYCNHDSFIQVEIPSVNVFSNARSLAKVADLMSRKLLLRSDIHEQAHSEPVTKFDTGICFETTFNKGGWCSFDQNHLWDEFARGFIGWGGFGGSQVCWNPDSHIGIAYTMNGPLRTSLMGFRDPRCRRLMNKTIASIEAQNHSS
mmetsp:Transcript_44807/g.71579  ORF Transcript_44807/g.71579 Transcript_44807/m.71579 type:complete len:476 (-) Transcript_44807:130-1557(-)|eukprot:CAMPEP_0203753244 /NCGR_PEP_ID=MMETSP0098-20131031/7045_1 /ASSEMBLY_ACC=CAM_ASM_000208 /TAXON_ID=96639 /ORGANISM=" , Strain NY0313808BC1" /LENGTH=475 /DNA_ID=CAMNT_0050643751 /DNA_START=1386 /DNA_END=2813 /DNA_ORIENTATION=-